MMLTWRVFIFSPSASALFSYRRASRAPGQWSFGGDEWLPQEEELFFGVVSRDFCAEKGLGVGGIRAHF